MTASQSTQHISAQTPSVPAAEMADACSTGALLHLLTHTYTCHFTDKPYIPSSV